MALRATKNVSLSFWALINGAPLFSTFCPDFREKERDRNGVRKRRTFLPPFHVILIYREGSEWEGTLPIKPNVLLAPNDPRLLLNLTLIDRNGYIDPC